MAALNVPLVNMNGGEIGGELMGRVDLDLYPTCAEIMENVLPLMQGAIIKAPGTEYIGRTHLDQKAIVRPFVFSIDQTRVLEITDSRIDIVQGNAYTDVIGAPATVGIPVNNGSTGGASITVSGQQVLFTCTANAEDAMAVWPITGGAAGEQVSFRFEIQRRPLSIRVGTSATAANIELPGPPGTFELILDPGVHIITFIPPQPTYYFNARLRENGQAILKGLTRVARDSEAGLFIPTPWLEGDLPRLRYRQSLDTFWFYHPDYQTRVLERRGNASWSLRLFNPKDGPFEGPNVTDTTMQPAALAGHTTITASKPIFTPQSVGQLIEITHRGQVETTTFTAADQATDPIRVFGTTGKTGQASTRSFQVEVVGAFTGAIELQRSVNEVDWVVVDTIIAPVSMTVDDGLDNQIIFYRLFCKTHTTGNPTGTLTFAGGETTGRAQIVMYNSTTAVTVEVFEPFGSTNVSSNWSLGAWSPELGWPAAGAIDDGHHCLVRDDRFWASVSDDYESFLLGSDPDSALARRFGTGEMNSSRWIEAARRLLIGTNGAEIEVTSNALDEPISPLNNRLRGFDDNGSADTQAMKAPANRVVFVDRARTKLYQCLVDNQTDDQHQTDDLTRLHEDIAGLISAEEAEAGDGGFVEIAVQRKPEPRIWCVRKDGQMAVLLFGPREGVYAWARVVAAETSDGPGFFRSVCVIPGAPEDRVHCIIERVVNGETQMHHERFGLQKFAIEIDARGVRSAPDAWRLQAALYSTEETPANVFTGLDHLEGETVSIWADGRVHPDRVVTGGTVTLERAFNTVLIGLNYIGLWRSVKMAWGAQMGTALTMEKNVGRVGFCLRDTPLTALSYGRSFEEALSHGETGSDGDELRDPISDDEGDFVMDAPTELMSGDFNQPFDGASDIDARLCIVMDKPMPVKILGMVPGMELYERE